MTSKFFALMSEINSSIFGDSDYTSAVIPFSRLLGCNRLPAFVGGGFPSSGDVDTRGSVPGSRVILTSIFMPGFLSNPGKSREIIFHCLCIIFN